MRTKNGINEPRNDDDGDLIWESLQLNRWHTHCHTLRSILCTLMSILRFSVSDKIHFHTDNFIICMKILSLPSLTKPVAEEVGILFEWTGREKDRKTERDIGLLEVFYRQELELITQFRFPPWPPTKLYSLHHLSYFPFFTQLH